MNTKHADAINLRFQESPTSTFCVSLSSEYTPNNHPTKREIHFCAIKATLPVATFRTQKLTVCHLWPMVI
jgi:hypothetical protein